MKQLKVKVSVFSQTLLIPMGDGGMTEGLVQAYVNNPCDTNFEELANWLKEDIGYELEFEVEDIEVMDSFPNPSQPLQRNGEVVD